MAATSDKSGKHTIVIHGGTVRGAGQVSDNQISLIRDIIRSCREKLILGDNALDVVVDAIMVMEDSGLFDAGKGSYFNREGFVENDASLMDGMTGRAGAVALLRRIKNPIQAAKNTMEKTPHVILAGTTGEKILIELGTQTVENPASYFAPISYMNDTMSVTTGTVGAVALDCQGGLAAGTSTGGTREKLPGRVSDSAIIGAGTFADERCAISTTGVGEYFIKRSAAFDIARRCEYLGTSLQESADYVIHDVLWGLDKAPGAVIAISREGDITLSSNVYGVIHGYASDSMDVTVGVRVTAE